MFQHLGPCRGRKTQQEVFIGTFTSLLVRSSCHTNNFVEQESNKQASKQASRKILSTTYRLKIEPFFLHINGHAISYLFNSRFIKWSHLQFATAEKGVKNGHLGHFVRKIQDGARCAKVVLQNKFIPFSTMNGTSKSKGCKIAIVEPHCEFWLNVMAV